MEFKCCGKRERVNSPCLGAFSGGRQLSESPAVAADRADPHAARPNPPGHRNSWKSSSQGGWGSIPGSNPHVLGRSLGLALQEQAGPGTQLLSPPPCSDRCHFSPPLVSKCFLRQLLVIIGIFFPPSLPSLAVVTCSSPQAARSEMHSLGFAPACPAPQRRARCVHLFGTQGSSQLHRASSCSSCSLFQNYPPKTAEERVGE